MGVKPFVVDCTECDLQQAVRLAMTFEEMLKFDSLQLREQHGRGCPSC